MKRVYLIFSLVFAISSLFAQKNVSSEEEIIFKLQNVSHSTTFGELSQLLNECKLNYGSSVKVVTLLSEWLRENHTIYRGKGYIEVMQFRAFLIYTFSFFVSDSTVLKYLIYELNYSDNNNIIAACLHTARIYNDSSLASMVRKFTSSNNDLKVNFMQYELGDYGNTTIQQEALFTWDVFRATGKDYEVLKPETCCSAEAQVNRKYNLNIIEKRDRKYNDLNIQFIDQYDEKINFRKFRGRPFLITFFYSSCTNVNKCASTVAKLKEFLDQNNSRRSKPGIYLISYDPYIDKPDVLRKYGNIYDFDFNSHSKFLIPATEQATTAVNSYFNTTVSFGNGQVTQHGTQLYFFDKKGMLACKIENEFWTVEDLQKVFRNLFAD
jgi:cytochrome oxidase Cu insertion factor (SCO1/SenC/PrrC family)